MKRPQRSIVPKEDISNCTTGQPHDPISDYFKTGSRQPIRKGSLLDISAARHMFDDLEHVCLNDYYLFQRILEGKSGPVVYCGGLQYLLVSSYDYLGLIGHPEIESASIDAIKEYGTGTGGVRILTGTIELHSKFEAKLADFKGTESSTTFSSGYAANLAVISSLFGPRDCVLVDAKAHRSIFDACKLARVWFRRFKHNDVNSLEKVLKNISEKRRTLIVVDGIYSMDGDICLLNELVELKNKYGAYLMVDEAHSFGVLGRGGKGIHDHFGVDVNEVDIWMGSLSKAIPANGGFIAGTRELIMYLQHVAAPFVFSAALSPSSVAAAMTSLRIMQAEPERITKVHKNAEFLRIHLLELGYDIGKSCSPIIPVIVGNDKSAYILSRKLFDLGILTTAVVQPAVPRGTARLRLCASASQDERFLDEVVKAFNTVRYQI